MILNIATDDAATTDGDSESEREHSDGGADPLDSLTDPAALAARGDVETTTATFAHDEADHCEADAGGRAIVGITNERGEVLLWVHENGHAILPNVVVDAGGDWARAAREDVAETAGLDVTLDAIERVREVDHVLAADGEGDDSDGDDDSRHLETTHHVVFAASPARSESERDGPAIDTCDGAWTARWDDSPPTDADPSREASVVADRRLFTE